jgi:hypothetical protein
MDPNDMSATDKSESSSRRGNGMTRHLKPVSGNVRLRIHWQEECHYITDVTLTEQEATDIAASGRLTDLAALRAHLNLDENQHIWFEAADLERDFADAEDRHVAEVEVIHPAPSRKTRRRR